MRGGFSSNLAEAGSELRCQRKHAISDEQAVPDFALLHMLSNIFFNFLTSFFQSPFLRRPSIAYWLG